MIRNIWTQWLKEAPFATAYFCKDLLPKDLIIERLNIYERPLEVK